MHLSLNVSYFSTSLLLIIDLLINRSNPSKNIIISIIIIVIFIIQRSALSHRKCTTELGVIIS